MAGRSGESNRIDARKRYLQGKLRRLCELYLDGDFTDADYRRRRDVLGQQLEAVEVPGESDILQAGAYLESLAGVWTGATQLERREMLRLMLQVVYVDVLEGCLVCIKPRPAFAALFRQVAGLDEREGCFHPAKPGELQ